MISIEKYEDGKYEMAGTASTAAGLKVWLKIHQKESIWMQEDFRRRSVEKITGYIGWCIFNSVGDISIRCKDYTPHNSEYLFFYRCDFKGQSTHQPRDSQVNTPWIDLPLKNCIFVGCTFENVRFQGGGNYFYECKFNNFNFDNLNRSNGHVFDYCYFKGTGRVLGIDHLLYCQGILMVNYARGQYIQYNERQYTHLGIVYQTPEGEDLSTQDMTLLYAIGTLKENGYGVV